MSEDPKEVSKNDLRNSQFGGGFIDAETVNADRIGGDIYNVVLNQQPTLTRQEYHNRQALLTKVKNFWVKGVLEKSLYNQVLIELGLEERPDAIANPLNEIFEVGDSSPQPLPEGTKVIDIFDAIGAGRTLLILGEPGSGKTTTLLELTRDLIARAEQDVNLLIPVVFNLSSWTNKRQKIADWLVEELNSKYDVPKKFGQAWVTKQQLLPLLDGLDEVKAQYQDDCIAALNQFKQGYGAELVVYSRIKDYEALSNRLNFQSAVYIRSLTLEQIYHYLDSVVADLTGLRALIEEDRVLQELASSPLMLNIMTLAYQEIAVENLPKVEVLEERQKQLFNDYIEKMFKHRKAGRQYPKEKAKYWLVWLARKLLEQNETEFFIEYMQSNWLENRRQKRVYNLIYGLIYELRLMLLAPIGVLGGWLIGGSARFDALSTIEFIRLYREEFFRVVIIGLIFGIIGWLIQALIYGLLVEVDRLKIGTVEVIQFSREKFFNTLITMMSGLLLGALIFYLTSWQTRGLLFSLIGVLFLSLIASLYAGLWDGLVKPNIIDMKTIPNQGILKTSQNALILGLIFGLMAGLFIGLLEGLSVGLIDGLFVGLFSGAFFGLITGLMIGKPCIKHFTLRLILYRKGYIPWNYARFLDYATDRIFLQKVGGGYIFIHRMLMEHFAQMECDR